MAVCDGISMNHEGMKYSLPSREIIAATVESMIKGHAFDGLVLIPSCDKVVPGMVGVDIGCGMETVRVAEKEIDFEKLDEAAHFIPSGKNVWEGRQEKFDLQELRCYRSLKDTKWL